jgi:hypothetical protein
MPRISASVSVSRPALNFSGSIGGGKPPSAAVTWQPRK